MVKKQGKRVKDHAELERTVEAFARDMQVIMKNSDGGILLKPITPIQDLAGVDAPQLSLSEMRRKLDDMRRRDRY